MIAALKASTNSVASATRSGTDALASRDSEATSSLRRSNLVTRWPARLTLGQRRGSLRSAALIGSCCKSR